MKYTRGGYLMASDDILLKAVKYKKQCTCCDAQEDSLGYVTGYTEEQNIVKVLLICPIENIHNSKGYEFEIEPSKVKFVKSISTRRKEIFTRPYYYEYRVDALLSWCKVWTFNDIPQEYRKKHLYRKVKINNDDRLPHMIIKHII